MQQTDKPQKRYWLRGGMIVVAVQFPFFIVALFVLFKTLDCLVSDVCDVFTTEQSNEFLSFIINAVDPLHVVRVLWDLPLPDAVVLVIDLLIIPIHLAIGFSIGAAIGSWYGERVERRKAQAL